MDPSEQFEDGLRRALQDTSASDPADRVDVEAFLGDVHRGARLRRTRRAIAGAAAAVTMVAGGGFALSATGAFDGNQTHLADDPTGTTSADATSTGTTNSADPTAEPSDPRPSHSAQPAPLRQLKPLSLTATGTEHQWVLASTPPRGCAFDRCATVFQTEDGGESWDSLGPLPAPPVSGTEDPSTVDEVRFAGDGTNGWAFRGALLSTHDGGQAWSSPDLPVDGNVRMLEAWGDVALAIIQTGRGDVLLRSPTDHDDWQVVDLGLTIPAIQQVAVADGVAGIIAWAGTGAQTGARNKLLVSTDDGSTWTERADACPADRWPYQLSTAAGALWLVCTDGRQTSVEVSVDAGQTWSAATGTFGQSPVFIAGRTSDDALLAGDGVDGVTLVSREQATSIDGQVLRNLVFFGCTNAEVCYQLNDDGRMLRSDSGGLDWSPYVVTP